MLHAKSLDGSAPPTGTLRCQRDSPSFRRLREIEIRWAEQLIAVLKVRRVSDSMKLSYSTGQFLWAAGFVMDSLDIRHAPPERPQDPSHLSAELRCLVLSTYSTPNLGQPGRD